METESLSKKKFFFASHLHSINQQSGETQISNPNGFEDLSPRKNVDIKTYNEALEWALNNDNVNNIAVTGPYGSGKSSILRTFENQHSNYRFLNISLASFNEVGSINSSIENQERLIELSILQQMFYKVEGNQIPNSRFDRIRHFSKVKLILLALFSVLFLIGFLAIFFPNSIERFDWWYDFRFNYPQLSLYVAIIFLSPISFLLFYRIASFLNSSKFNKVNLTNGGIEFDLKSDASILNKHIDEILYFFTAMPYNVVVFEDLDRFNKPEIFTKLREINLLINNSQEINRHVIFIYAIKDDMFQDKTRTKFFDFIIPIIPVINNSNSYEKMREKFQNKELELFITDNFINAITLFIDDMRILKNIFNEFVIYKKKLENISLNQDKLLAIVVYKNIYPNDFAALHENKGVVYNIFQRKSELIKRLLKEKQNTISQLRQEIAKSNRELKMTIGDLRAIYLFAIANKAQNTNAAKGLNINGTTRSFSEIQKNDELFQSIINEQSLSYYYYNQSLGNDRTASLGKSFLEIEKEVDQDLTYNDRQEIIITGNTNQVNELTNQIKVQELEIENLRHSRLTSLLQQESSFDFLSSNSEEENLLIYLVKEGYIDENYPSFMSYFYEGSLTSKDKNFLLSIQTRDQLQFDYPISNFKNIVERLDETDFKKEGILNFKLLDYLLSEKGEYSHFLTKLISQIKCGSTISLQFIYEYSKNGNQREEFYSLLFNEWPAFWDFIFNKSGYSFLEKDKYLFIVINYANENAIKKLNSNYNLSKYISSNNRFLSLFTDDIEISKAINIISYCNVKFVKLDWSKNESKILDFICENDAYVLNKEMINIVLEYKTKYKNAKEIAEANYTAVRSAGYSPLVNYVGQNINKYVTSVVLSEENINETEASVIELLNCSNLSEDLKEKIIEHQTIKIENILSVPSSLWNILLLNNKLIISWDNILIYFEKYHFSDEIFQTLNTEEHYKSLSKHLLSSNENVSDHTVESFSGQLLLTDQISDTAYSFLIESIPFQYPDGLDISGLNESKVRTLIEKQKIILNVATFARIKEFHNNLTVALIEKNIDDYLNNFNSYPIQISDYIYLLRSDRLADNLKSKLLQTISIDLFSDETFNTAVTTYLINAPVSSLPGSVLREIIISDKTTNKLDILTKYLNLFSKEEIFSILPFLGNKLEEIRPGSDDLHVAHNEFSSALLEGLKRKNVIKSYKKQRDEIIIKNIEN